MTAIQIPHEKHLMYSAFSRILKYEMTHKSML